MSAFYSPRALASLLTPLALTSSLPLTLAEESAPVEEIEVRGHRINNSARAGSADQLLKASGLAFSVAGGASSLPVLHGMRSDRIKVLIDGADITAACANHMNPPLSYISANQIAAYQVVAGISPVSLGEDNIAGVIRVEAIDPAYSKSASLGWSSGYLSADYRSNGDGRSLGMGAELASESVSIRYRGALDESNSYEDGNGNSQLDTLYKVQNHSLVTALRDDKQQLAVKLTYQQIPYQGFPNQYMDMTDNTSYGLVSRYHRKLSSGDFEAQINWQKTSHEMGFFSDEKTGQMPMNTESDDVSYQLRWKLRLSDAQTLILGQDYYDFRIDDWWPAVEGSMMMGPNDYININDGTRKRLSAFAEWENQITPSLWWSLGARVTGVRMNAGEVQAYNEGMNMSGMMGMSPNNAMAAQQFNAQGRKKKDTLIDATGLITYRISDNDELQLGLARKNRAPNIYERYSWGVSNMATTMIGWFGDGNGYIGNIDLKPETANTLSATYNKSLANGLWNFSANVWYTRAEDYIDADPVRSFASYGLAGQTRHVLQFTNVDATLYGTELELNGMLHNSKRWGDWQLNVSASNTRGSRDDTHQPLYQIKPWQTTLTLKHQLGPLESSLSWQWVDDKTRVDTSRRESITDSYSLLNFDTKMSWQRLTLGLEATNLLDEYYQEPLGGINLALFKSDPTLGFQPINGRGRSVNVYARIKF